MTDARRLLTAALCLIAMTVSAFWPVIGNQFTDFDDDAYVADNVTVKAGLTREGLVWALGYQSANWHPLTWLSHMADVELFGLHPAGHHATNLLFHAGNAVLLLLVLRMMTGRLWPAATVAALFAVHPLRVESVAWVAERKDVLSGFLGLLTLGAYGRYAQRPGAGRYSAVVLAFSLGLTAKPMLVTLPFLMMLLDFWPLARLERRSSRGGVRLFLEKTPLLALAAVSAVLTIRAQQEGGAIGASASFSAGARAANAAVSYGRYLLKTIWPQGLSAFYPYPIGGHPPWQVAAAVLGLCAVTALGLRGARRRPHLAVGWLWYLGMMVPVIGVVQVGGQSMADRYTYLPLVGLSVAVVWEGADLLSRHSFLRTALPLAAGGVCAALMVFTRLQAGHWRDTGTLFRHAVEVDPANDLAHLNLGVALFAAGRVEEAIGHYREALRVDPLAEDAHNNLGAALLQQGKTTEALAHFREALRICPDFADAYNNIGLALAARGQGAAAAPYIAAALRLRALGNRTCATR
jgi:hypothetical protein